MARRLPIKSDPDILGGVPVFEGSRVPVKTLFDYLKDDYSLDQFLEFFPTVKREAAAAVLEDAERVTLEKARSA